MKAGKVVSLLMWLALTGLSALVILGSGHVDFAVGPTTMVGALALCFAIVLLPVGLLVDRAIGQLRKGIESSAELDDAPLASGPRSLQPISRAVAGALDQLRQREQDLKTQLRDLEIRHQVSEVERRQTQAVLHSLRDGVLVTDGYGDVVLANAMAGEILGFDVEEAIHKPMADVIDDRQVCDLIVGTRDTSNFNDRRHVELELETRSDSAGSEQRVYDVSLVCVENRKGEVGSVVTILTDLTREREVSEMKSDFVSKASHELRTPLSCIRAYIEMLVDGEAEGEAARNEFYTIIQNETDRLGRLIDNMLNISRIEAGIIQIDRASVDMKELVERALETLEPPAREKSISLNRTDVPVDLCVEGDADMLYQVVLNLVSNAVKYTPDGGRITVSVDSDNLTRSVVLSVSDTGLGIPPDALPRLFDKFYRVENYKRVAKGTGLGLSLCKHIVETVHHGQIGVDSKLGMGSRFWCSIPMDYAGTRAAA